MSELARAIAWLRRIVTSAIMCPRDHAAFVESFTAQSGRDGLYSLRATIVFTGNAPWEAMSAGSIIGVF